MPPKKNGICEFINDRTVCELIAPFGFHKIDKCPNS